MSTAERASSRAARSRTIPWKAVCRAHAQIVRHRLRRCRVGRTSQGLARLDGQRWTDVTDRVECPPATSSIDAGRNRSLGSIQREHRFTAPCSAHVHVYTMRADNVFRQIARARVDDAANSRCLYLLDATATRISLSTLPAGTFALWLVPRGDEIWISDTSDHMRVIPTPDVSATRRPPSPIARSLPSRRRAVQRATRPRGNIWFGTGGLEQMRVARLRTMAPLRSWSCWRRNHNSLWVGTMHGDSNLSATTSSTERWAMETYADGRWSHRVYREPTGALWIGAWRTLEAGGSQMGKDGHAA